MTQNERPGSGPSDFGGSSQNLVSTMRVYFMGACALMVVCALVSLWRLQKTQNDFQLIVNDNVRASALLYTIQTDVKSLDRLIYATKFPNASSVSASEIENKILLEKIVDEHDRFAEFSDQDREKSLSARWFVTFVTYTSKTKEFLALKNSDKQTFAFWNQELGPLKQSILEDLDSLDQLQNIEASRRETALLSSLNFSKWMTGLLVLLGCAMISYFGNRTIRTIDRSVKKRERAIKLEQEALTSIRNAAAKTEFMASMSHEIRTPLGAIIGISEILMRESNDTRLRQIVQTLASSSDHLHHVVNNFLDFTKLEGNHSSLNLIPSRLSRLVRDRIDLLQIVVERSGTNLVYDTNDIGDDEFFIDETKFSQVILNLTGNAIKFAKGGTVEVRVLVGSSSDNKTAVRIEIRDTGIGMTEKQISGLFQAYKQASNETEKKFGGTGLGLVISHQIVRMMNGKISVSSVVGEGSLFVVELQLERVGQKEVVTPSEDSLLTLIPIPHGEPFKNMKILVAEDNSTNQLVISAILKHLNIPFTIVTDGEAAVSAVKDGNYDLVLMDCHMPNSDGFEATREIRILEDRNQSRRRIPIVALTASSNPTDRARCLSAGMDTFAMKPIKSEILRNVILEVMQTAA